VGSNKGELVFQKSTSGPANSTKMDHTLRVLGIHSVIVTGVVTEICVAQTTRELGDRDFNALVVEDACASMSEMRHQSALETIGLTFNQICRYGWHGCYIVSCRHRFINHSIYKRKQRPGQMHD